MQTEAKVQHTPGPWEVVHEGHRLSVWADGYGFVHTHEAPRVNTGATETANANALLIAQAPALLDVARTLVEIQGGECLFDVLNPCTLSKEPGKHWGGTPENPVKACAVCKAKMAIAKVEGR